MDRVEGGTAKVVDAIADLFSAQIQLLLLRFCAVPMVGDLVRAALPSECKEATEEHDKVINRGLMDVLNTGHRVPGPGEWKPAQQYLAQLPLAFGGLGLGSAAEIRGAAFAASFAACHDAIVGNEPLRRLMGWASPVGAQGESLSGSGESGGPGPGPPVPQQVANATEAAPQLERPVGGQGALGGRRSAVGLGSSGSGPRLSAGDSSSSRTTSVRPISPSSAVGTGAGWVKHRFVA